MGSGVRGVAGVQGGLLSSRQPLERCLACEAEGSSGQPRIARTPLGPVARSLRQDRSAATRRPRKRGSAPGLRDSIIFLYLQARFAHFLVVACYFRCKIRALNLH
jgi:hypothetical protein